MAGIKSEKMELIVKRINGFELHNKPPDGGWGWVVLFSSFFIFAIVFSVAKSIGMFFVAFQAEFESSASETAWVASICTSMLGLAGIPGGLLMSRIGARNVLLFAGPIGCVGMIVAAYSINIWMIYIGIGLLFGITFSWSFVCTITQLNIYFCRWRGLATGIAAGGSSIGSFALPLLVHYLFTVYGWRGTLVIFAGISLNISMLGALIRPISVFSRKDEKLKSQVKKRVTKVERAERIKSINVSMEVLDYIQQATNQDALPVKKIKQSNAPSFFEKYWVLMLLGVIDFAFGLAMYTPLIFIVPFAKELQFQPGQVTFLLSMMSAGDIICRPLSGSMLSFFPVLEKRLLLCLGIITLFMAGANVIPVVSSGYETILVYCALYGCLFGMFISCVNVEIAVLAGIENVEKLVGPKVFISGLSSLAGPPLAGYFTDYFGTCRAAFWYALGCMFVTSIHCFVCDAIVHKLGAVLPEHRPRKN